MNRRHFLGAAGAAAVGAWTPRGLTGVAAPGAAARRLTSPCLGAARVPTDLPVPSAAQLSWQRDETAMFVHFGVNTFTNREWGDGTESPALFDPRGLDARQWAREAKAGGFRAMILTAKHHDGFCLWPSALTDHSVARSPWRDGKGDVVHDLVEACRAEGLRAGLYLSPWDRHEPSYGDSPRYMDYYVGQLTELLTRYGPVSEVWFDGANGEGPNGKRQVYHWERIHRTVRTLQPGAVMFSDAGPDVRWIGNEDGAAGDPNWSMVNPALVPYAGFSGPGVERALQHGDRDGTVWRPGEADVSIRPGWFWHPAESDRVKSAAALVELYGASVGRNSKLLLNVPPTTDGLLHDVDVRRLAEFRARLDAIFATDLSAGASASAIAGRSDGGGPAAVLDADPDTYWAAPDDAPQPWVEVDLGRPVTFDTVVLQEAIQLGQRVESYRLQCWDGARLVTVARGTTIGHKKLDRFAPVTARRVRLTIDAAMAAARIGRLALYRTPPDA